MNVKRTFHHLCRDKGKMTNNSVRASGYLAPDEVTQVMQPFRCYLEQRWKDSMNLI